MPRLPQAVGVPLMVSLALLAVIAAPRAARSEDAAPAVRPQAQESLRLYWEAEAAALRDRSLAQLPKSSAWPAWRQNSLRELREMLGLDPLPEKTDLKPVVTGVAKGEGFRVERVHFQSRPQLYVTGNLYLPEKLDAPAPAILYLCGHGAVKRDGVSYGNKVHYQHHGAWFARHGYVCLTIDSLQLGEIEGLHHGTHNLGQWWWVNRGYTPAGVEAWNCIRALDYLETRKEVDRERMGVTGRSGGGAYSWWIAALDERIKAAVPVAGITDLENHVADGVVDGHCDCMYMVNTYRWDYPQVAALVAPRPLLISNTDRDPIFPLEGVVRTHAKTRRVYQLLSAAPQLALQITAGGHADTQELHIHSFRWFDQHLRGEPRLIEKPAVKFFEPAELQVFDKLPSDSINRRIQETFVAAAPSPALPDSAEAWSKQRETLLTALREKTFGGWPAVEDPPPRGEAFSVERDGIRLAAYDFQSQNHVPLRLYVAQRAGLREPELAVLNLLGKEKWSEFLATFRVGFEKELAADALSLPKPDAEAFKQVQGMFAAFPWVMAYVSPRGAGREAFAGDAKRQNQINRRYYLLGQTRDGMQAWDVVQSTRVLRQAVGEKPALWLQAEEPGLAGVALYAAILSPEPLKRLDLYALPTNHRQGPYLLNVDRILDLPTAVALAAERSQVILYGADDPAWNYPRQVADRLGWDKKRLQIRKPAKAE